MPVMLLRVTVYVALLPAMAKLPKVTLPVAGSLKANGLTFVTGSLNVTV